MRVMSLVWLLAVSPDDRISSESESPVLRLLLEAQLEPSSIITVIVQRQFVKRDVDMHEIRNKSVAIWTSTAKLIITGTSNTLVYTKMRPSAVTFVMEAMTTCRSDANCTTFAHRF